MYTFSPMMVANSRKHHCRVRSYTREVLVISTNLDIQKNHYPLDFRNRRGDEARIKNTWYNQGYCRDHMEEEELKNHIEIVKDDEVAIDAIPLATKPPVIDGTLLWKNTSGSRKKKLKNVGKCLTGKLLSMVRSVYPGDLNLDKDNDDNEIDMIQSSRDIALPPQDQRHQYLRYEGLQYTDADVADFETRLSRIYMRELQLLVGVIAAAHD
ncbi:hypothetical protein Tco_0236344 [Tanacetum coccineum]